MDTTQRELEQLDPFPLKDLLGPNVCTSVLAINAGQAVSQAITEGPVWSLILCCLVVSAVPALIAWWIGRHVGLNPALLMGAIAGARQNTLVHAVCTGADDVGGWRGIGYPVPLAITTLTMSVIAYVFALFS